MYLIIKVQNRIYRWISLDFKMIVAQMALHAKLVERRTVVHSNFCFFCVISHPHADMIAASIAPYVVRHFEADDENAHVKLTCSLSESVSSHKLVEAAYPRIVIRRVVVILSLAFTHFSEIYKLVFNEIFFFNCLIT